MGIVEHLSQSFNDVREETKNLLWCAERHVADGFDSGVLSSPIVSVHALKEHWHNALNGIVAEIHDYLPIGGVCTGSNCLSRVCDAVENIRKDCGDKWLERFALGKGESFVEYETSLEPQGLNLLPGETLLLKNVNNGSFLEEFHAKSFNDSCASIRSPSQLRLHLARSDDGKLLVENLLRSILKVTRHVWDAPTDRLVN